VATDLFATAAGPSAAALQDAVPPACRCSVEPAPAARREGDDLILEFPAWRPRRPGRHFVPAFGAVTRVPYSLRFELSGEVGGRWSDWVGSVGLGLTPFGAIDGRNELLESEIDLWRARQPVERVRLRIRLRAREAATVLGAPWLATLSVWDGAAADAAQPAGAVRLSVPALSQIVEGGHLGSRICSPTSVAMVLTYWDAADTVTGLAAEMFHPELDLYGVWPAAIQAAARRGVLGYLLRFPDWASAAWCLRHGLPIIASVRYDRGELAGAAIAATAGHLLVLTGYEDGSVLVNDPAASEPSMVPRRYAVQDLARVWLARAGVGYVLFRPGHVVTK
jgi:hypothetical protein